MVTDYSKQTELIKPHEFTERINVIGAGALGSWIVFFLLKMGFSDVHVYDFDNIEEHNLPNQMFRENDIGALKASATLGIYMNFFNDGDGNERLTIHNERLTADSDPLKGIIISAVDTMSARKELYEVLYKFNPQAKMWIEGRLSIYGAYVYTLWKNSGKDQFKAYEATLYDDTEAEVSACGVSQTALPSAVNCATIMIMQMIGWHNDQTSLLNKIEYSIPWFTAMTGTWE